MGNQSLRPSLRLRPLAILVLLVIIIELILFAPILFHLNHCLFTAGGDGIKNYYTYLFYLKWDAGVHFTGMNYPFGENVVFTDNTPLLAWTLKIIGHFFPAISQYGLGIMHASLLLSIPISAIYIFKIQKLFNVSDSWAVGAAIIITFFSPQIFNLNGFFGMAFLIYLPFLIYLLMKYHYKGKLHTLFSIYVLALCFTFLHVYHMAFMVILAGFYTIAYLIIFRRRSIKNKIRHLLPLLITALLAVGTLSVYFKIFDPVTDRTTYPYGIFGGKTDLGDIFTSRLSPLGFTFQFLFGRAKGPEEGYTYIGLIAIVVVLILLLYLITAIVVKIKYKRKVPVHPVRAYRIWILIALLQILFAMGVPFKHNLDFWADHVSLLREFRSVGRFSWCSYYLLLIFCSIFVFRLYVWLKRRKKNRLSIILTIVFFSIWSIQLSGYFEWLRTNIVNPARKNYIGFFDFDQKPIAEWLSEKGFPPLGFQCIMGLPYFHIGSEKIWLQDNDWGRTMFHCAKLSLKTGLPMTDVQMSRTSWKQTFASVQLIDGPYAQKPLLKDSFSSKPILVMVNKHFPLKTKEKEWITSSAFIGTYNDFDFYSVTPQTMIENGIQLRDSIGAIALSRKQAEGIIGDSSGVFWVNHFDEQKTAQPFAGAGAFNPANRTKEQLLATFHIRPHTLTDSSYMFAIWAHCNHVDYRSPIFIFRQYDGQGQLIKESDLNTKYSTHIIHNWYLIDKTLIFAKNIRKLNIYILGPKDYVAVDEMAVWPANKVYFYKTPDGKLFLNNRPQEKQE